MRAWKSGGSVSLSNCSARPIDWTQGWEWIVIDGRASSEKREARHEVRFVKSFLLQVLLKSQDAGAGVSYLRISVAFTSGRQHLRRRTRLLFNSQTAAEIAFAIRMPCSGLRVVAMLRLGARKSLLESQN